jgi:hypothetical protein
MSDQIKISATVLPRELSIEESSNKKYLVVEVALNPYLSKSRTREKELDSRNQEDALDYYPEILNWYKYFEIFKRDIEFRFSVFNKDFKRLQVKFETIIGSYYPYPADECIETGVDSAERLWRSMFFNHTAVSAWSVYETPYDITGRLSSNELTNDIVNALDACIDELLNDRQIGNNDVWLAHYLTDLRQRPDLTTEVLNDPVLSNSFDSRLQKYYDTIDRLIKRYNKELNDMYFDISIREQQSRNVENTSEFHKKFTAYSNHAYLMKKTGWIWRYRINITDHESEIIKETGNRIFIGINDDDSTNYRYPLWRIMEGAKPKTDQRENLEDPFYLSFLREVKFVYPITAVKFFHQANALQNVFVESKANGSNSTDVFVDIHPQYGFIKVHNGDVRLICTVLDRKQLMDKLDAQYQAITTARTKMESGAQNAQNRELSEAISNEKQITAKALLPGGGGVEYTNNGITLALTKLYDVVRSSVSNTPATISREVKLKDETTSLEGSAIIYLHHIVAGYRVDVYAFNQLSGTADSHDFEVGSLCEKEECFYVNDRKDRFFVAYPNSKLKLSYEGWLGATAQGSNSSKLYIDEELGRWNNWSLSCMRMGDNQPYINRPDNASRLTIAVLPPCDSMVSQRFGWKYCFALRPADISGGGPLPFHKQFPADAVEHNQIKQKLNNDINSPFVSNYWSEPITYKRVDAIPSPMVLAGVKLFKPLPKLDQSQADQKVPERVDNRWGEDLMTMVVRTFYGNGELKHDPNHESATTVRYIGPPHAGIDFVMQHGALDNCMLLPNRNSRTDKELDALRDELFDLAEKAERNIDYYLTRNTGIDYLYDPLANGLVIEIDNLYHSKNLGWGMFTDQPQSERAYGYVKHKYWKAKDEVNYAHNHEYYKLTLKNKSTNGTAIFNYDEDNGIISLKQGCELIMNINCTAQSSRNKVELFYPGIEKARTTSVTIVHAVQKPCLLHTKYHQGDNFHQNIKRSTLDIRRYPGLTEVVLDYRFEKFPVLTSEAYFLHVQYIDVIGDRHTAHGYRLEKIEKVIKSGILPLNPNLETDVVFRNIEHSFDSTICRAANYRIEAVSRFRKFFDPTINEPAAFSVFGVLRQNFADTKDVNNDNDPDTYRKFIIDHEWFYIQSSQRPNKPLIEKIVPQMQWQTLKTETDFTVTRKCHTVRIYFDGDWYSSGADEKVAVFFLKGNDTYSSSNVIDLSGGLPKSLQGVLSQFGLDPASGDFNSIATIDTAFFRNTIKHEFLHDIPLNELSFARSVGDEDLPSDITICAALYDIQFMSVDRLNKDLKDRQYGNVIFEKATEGKYFVDIAINDAILDTHYFPFLRLAIARYQPHAKPTTSHDTLQYHFSEVVLTDFVQLLPYRKIRVLNNSTIEFNAPQSRLVPVPAVTELGEKEEYRSNNILSLIGVPAGITTRGDSIVDITNKNALATQEIISTCIIQPGLNMISFNMTGLQLMHILEYEDYCEPPFSPNSTMTLAPSDAPNDLRNDHRRRLVFSYTLTPNT